MTLTDLVVALHQVLKLQQKQDIQIAARYLSNQPDSPILLGDDCAAIPDQEGYLLLAAEGMWPVLVESEPWFAGWCSILVNVSDIYAMGGRPLAVVDTFWSQSPDHTEQIWAGMVAASQAYQVPIVGGHSNAHSSYNALSVAILGRAAYLLSSFTAQPGDVLLMAIDLRGTAHPQYPFWNASTTADPQRLRGDLEILPDLAESGLCDCAKDISMGGLVGTLLMLLEASQRGAVLNIEAIPRPDTVPLPQWLACFPSYGFLLSVRPGFVAAVQSRFRGRNLGCEAIGTIQASSQLILRSQNEEVIFWDLTREPLTGFSKGVPT